MEKLVLLLFFLLCLGETTYAQLCNSPGQAQIDLSVNNVKARLLNSGDLWWNLAEGKYIAPANNSGSPEVTAIFAGAFWFGGENPNGALKLAAQKYREGNATDFYPGPLELGALSVPVENCQNWDRFWVVNKSDVDAHISDYNDNNVIDNPSTSIFSWPGRNNPSFNSNNGFALPPDHNLAPFFDRNQDGNYNPDQGDYPLIKGDQSIWWVFNDLAGPHRQSQALPMSIEVQVMAYAESSTNEHINNATYYDLKVTNQGIEPLLRSYMGLWVDFDLGCPTDDFMGYDEEYQMMYAYNEDAVDGQNGSSCPGGINTYNENIPIIGIKQIGTSDFPVTSFSVYNGGSGLLNAPQNDFGYYNILKGEWKDGTALTFGGNGFDPTSIDTVSYLYTGDPSDENSWSMCTADAGFEDRKCVMSTQIGTIQPGQSFTNSYSVIFVENQEHPCPNLDKLKEAADDVCSNVLSSIVETDKKLDFQVYPNPANEQLFIKSQHPIQKVQLLNIEGQVIFDRMVKNQNLEYSLNLNDINSGLYFISVQDNNGRMSIEKVIVQK